MILAKSVLLTGVLVSTSGWGLAQNGLGQTVPSGPRIGFFLSRNQELHSLYGLSANLVLGGVIYQSAGAAAFSNSAGLVRVGDVVFLHTVGSESRLNYLATLPLNGEPAPVVGISAGAGNAKTALAGHAAIWLPTQNALALWNGEEFAVTPTDPLPGQVVSLVPGAQSVALMVQVAGSGIHRVEVGVANGQIISNTQVNGQATSGYEQNGWILLATKQGLVVNGANGVSRTLANISDAVSFAPLSDEWVQVQSQRGIAWLLHLDQNALAANTLAAAEIPVPRPRVRRVPL